jgi:hypothetical protein
VRAASKPLSDAEAWRLANELYREHEARICCCPEDFVRGVYVGLKAAHQDKEKKK